MAKLVARVKTETGIKFVVGKKTLEIGVADVPKEIYDRLVVHGLNAKVGDSAAGLKTESEIVTALSATIEQLKRGIFNATRSGSGATLLAEAVAELKGIEVEAAINYLGMLDDEKLKIVEANAKVKAIVARKRAERLAKAAESAEEDDDDLPEM